MAPLAPNSTSVVFVDYFANGFEHTVQFRTIEPLAPSPAELAAIDAALVAFNAVMPVDYDLVRFRFRAQGSNLTFPISHALPTVLGVNPGGGAEFCTFMTFVGRGANGRRASLQLIGTGIQPQDFAYANNYRITDGEAPYLGAIIDAVGAASPVAIGLASAVWYRYVNVGYNAYWQRRNR